MRSNISNDISANVLWKLIFHVRLAALLSYLLRIHFLVLLYIAIIIYLILLQCFLTFIMTFWNFQNIISTYDCQIIAFSFVREPVFMQKKTSFHMLWKFFQDIHGQKYHMSQNLQKITFLCNSVSFWWKYNKILGRWNK